MTARRAAELAALAAGLVVWGYVGWDGALWDARFQALLHVIAAGTLIGLVTFALRGGELPRTRIDLPILALLLAFGVASLSAWNAGLSAAALAGILATAAMLPIALVALRHRPGWTAVVVVLPILALGAASLVMLAWRRLEWVVAGGPGLPPVRLGQEGTPFGSVAVAPFVFMAALPIALLIPNRSVRLAVCLALVAVGVPLALASGSRSAWLAIAVSVAVLGAPAVARGAARLRRRRITLTPGRVGLGAAALGVAALALAFVAPRVTDVSSLVYRGFLWRDTLAAWRTDPLLGIGPGSMPFARQAYAPALSFPVRQPHSHDVPLGILGDAGLIGLAAALALFVTFIAVAGPWRTRRLPGRAAFAVLIGFSVGLLFEDLTFLPGFSLLVILLAAMALTDAGAVAWAAPRLPRAGTAVGVVAAAALLVIVAFGDAAAVAYRIGTDEAGSERWTEAKAWLARSVTLDPWHPTGPKSLAVAADRGGDAGLARRSAERATQLAPGDGPSWVNLAFLCLADGDAACARRAADRAVDTATAPGPELANAAVVYEALGDQAAADRAYRLSLLTNLWTSLTLPWPRPVEVGMGTSPEIGARAGELNLVIGRRAQGEPIVPDDYDADHARALAFAMAGDRAGAEGAIARAKDAAPESALTWDLAALLARHYGADDTRLLTIGEVVRGTPLAEGASRPAWLIFDIATFRAYPSDGLVSAATRLLPTTPWPWVLDPLLASPAAGGG